LRWLSNNEHGQDHPGEGPRSKVAILKRAVAE
jgi:hypothetical protein